MQAQSAIPRRRSHSQSPDTIADRCALLRCASALRARGLFGYASRPQEWFQSRIWGSVGTSKARAGDRCDTGPSANSRDGLAVAVGDAEGRHALLFGVHRSFHGVTQALAKADGDQKILWGQCTHAALNIPPTSHRRLPRQSERHQTINQVPTERGGQVDTDHQNSSRPVGFSPERDDRFYVQA